jgi:hypothetical protein
MRVLKRSPALVPRVPLFTACVCFHLCRRLVQMMAMNPGYSESTLPQVEAQPWEKVFKSRPHVTPAAMDLLSKMLVVRPPSHMRAHAPLVLLSVVSPQPACCSSGVLIVSSTHRRSE